MVDYNENTGMKSQILSNNCRPHISHSLDEMKIGMNQRNEINVQTINYLIKDDLPFLHNIVVREEDLNYYENPIKEEFIHDNNLLPNCKQDEIPIYKFESKEMNNLETNISKIILLVGKTGNGKTTWINFLINALLGVKFEDNYRFKMIVENNDNDQANSITKGVHEYNVKIRGYLPIKIIDCQGFDDTTDIAEDKKLLPELKKLFESIKRIDCICCVINETQFRLDSLSKYINHSIVDLFGKNVKNNIVFLATFSKFKEDSKNKMLHSLNKGDSFFREIISDLKEPYYFQFENGSFFNKGNEYDKRDFNKSMENMSNFLKKKLIRLESIPLKDSIEVLKERLELESYCNNVLNKRKQLIDKKQELEKKKKNYQIIEKKLLKILK